MCEGCLLYLACLTHHLVLSLNAILSGKPSFIIILPPPWDGPNASCVPT